jgi:hypothetical protein
MRVMSSSRNVLAVSALLVAALGSTFIACSSESEPAEEHQSVLEGELRRVVIGDPERGIAQFQYFVELPGERWIELVTDSVQEEAINRKVVVRGQALGTSRFRVHTIEVPEPSNDGVGTVSEPVIAPSPKKVAVILANFTNDTSQPITPEQARERVFTGTSSSNAYFKEISFGARSLVGITNVSGGDVFGWYTLNVSNTPCDYSAWGSSARSMAQAAGVNLSGYDHVIHYFPRASSCSFSGVGQLPGRYNWINGSSSSTIAHELGHNFGVHHASSLRCTSGSANVPISSTCTSSEYGDPFDVMGRGYRHMSAYQKGRLAWLEAANTVTVSAAGDFNVVPIETKSTSGIQSLRVRIPGTSEYYYVEYRQPFGFDSFSATSAVANGVLIHRATDYTSLVRTQLIDNVPSTTTFDDAALGVGRTFTDAAASISITLVSRTATAAVVRVSLSGSVPDAGPPPSDGGTDAGTPPPACGAGETLFGGHCYVVLTTAQRHADAVSACSTRTGGGWALATVSSASENQFISGLIGSNESWLGATDATTEGTWVWTTGQQTFWTGGVNGGPVGGAYENFTSDEPNDAGGADCLRMIAGGQWRDIACTSSYRAVCEKG